MDGYVWSAAPSPSCVGRRSPKLPPKVRAQFVMSLLCRLDQAMPLAEELEHPLPAFQIDLVDGSSEARRARKIARLLQHTVRSKAGDATVGVVLATGIGYNCPNMPGDIGCAGVSS